VGRLLLIVTRCLSDYIARLTMVTYHILENDRQIIIALVSMLSLNLQVIFVFLKNQYRSQLDGGPES
jgi:hypothetical protein